MASGDRRPAAPRDRRAAGLARQQAQERARAEAQRRHRRGRRLTFGAVALLVVLALGGLGALLVDGGGDHGAGGTVASTSLLGELVSPTGAVTPIDAPPAEYHVVYRSESALDAGGTTVATEDLRVRRPFDGHVIARSGEPPGGDVQVDVATRLGRSLDRSDPSAVTALDEVPALAIGDLRLDGSLQDLVAAGLFQPREVRRVLGRDCQVYRTGSAPETGELGTPTEVDHVDVCVDATGIVLEEVTVVGARVAQRTVATTFDLAPGLTDADFDVAGDPAALDEGGTELVPLDLAAPAPTGTWTFPRPPGGWSLQARYRATRQDPTLTDPTDDPSASSTTVAGDGTVQTTVEVWVRGLDALVVEQGPAAGEGAASTRAAPLPTTTMGDASFTPQAAGSTLVAHPDAGGFVRLTSTTSLLQLAALANELAKA